LRLPWSSFVVQYRPEIGMNEETGKEIPGSNPVVVVIPGPTHVYLGPLGTHRRASDFLEAAEFVRERQGRFTPVAAFLCCRSVELTLKAFLLARDNASGKVKEFGHDIVHLLIEAHARGLDAVVRLSADELAALPQANDDYMNNRLAYFDLFATISHYPKQPEPAALADVAAKLLAGVERDVMNQPMGRGTR
jgi:HEPN domain-containing protein